MELKEYQRCLSAIPFGKRLPNALYVYLGDNVRLNSVLDSLLPRWRQRFEVTNDFNVLKFRTDELKISFLSYPDFLTDPHPSLRHAITIDLAIGKARRTAYTENINPPILHRNESFLPPDHPLRSRFEALTKAEEAAGLYENTTTIGFRLNWERLLAEKGLTIRDDEVVPAAAQESAASRQMIRFSLGLGNTADDVKAALSAIARAVKMLRG